MAEWHHFRAALRISGRGHPGSTAQGQVVWHKARDSARGELKRVYVVRKRNDTDNEALLRL